MSEKRLLGRSQVDVALIVVSLLGFMHPAYVFTHCRRAARKREDSAQKDVANSSKKAEAK